MFGTGKGGRGRIVVSFELLAIAIDAVMDMSIAADYQGHVPIGAVHVLQLELGV